MWRFARRLIDLRAAAVTAVVCALNPLLIFYTGYFSSEVPALALVTGALWLLLRARQGAGRAAVASAAGAGVLAAAAVATRPQFGLNVALLALPLLWRARTAWRPLVAFAAAGLVVIALVASYNSRAADSPVLLGESGGMVFFQGHCDVSLVTAGSARSGGCSRSATRLPRSCSGAATTPSPTAGVRPGLLLPPRPRVRGARRARARLAAGAQRVGRRRTTTPFPLGLPPRQEAAARAANLVFTLAFAAAVVLGLLYVVRRWRRGAGWDGIGVLLLQLLTVVPVVMVFSSEPRYRILYDSFAVAILAALYFAARDALDATLTRRAARRPPFPALSRRPARETSRPSLPAHVWTTTGAGESHGRLPERVRAAVWPPSPLLLCSGPGPGTYLLLEHVPSGAAGQAVPSGAAGEAVVARVARQTVSASAAGEAVVARATGQAVVA